MGFLKMLKKSLQLQKETVGNLEATQGEKSKQIEESRLALLQMPAEAGCKATGEPKSEKKETYEYYGKEYKYPAKVSSGKKFKYPFDPLLDQDYVFESNNYLEDWMAKKWGPLKPYGSVPQKGAVLASVGSEE